MSTELCNHISERLSSSAIVNNAEEVLSNYLKGTEGLDVFEDKKRSLAVAVKVDNAEDVQALLKLANEIKEKGEQSFSIYPISSGLNWGYGTKQPPSINSNIVLLDLSAMSAIIDFDEDLGVVTLEAGVTQQQLYDFLDKHNYDYMVPTSGAGPECSIVGNAVERGYGITPYTDHFGAVNAIQGYWADGTEYNSAIYQLDQSKDKVINSTFKWGIGPYLEGLFTQSNYGIVTKMSVRLAKRAPAFTSFFVQLKSDTQLEDAIPLIRKVLQDYEGIVSSINLMDQRRILSMFADNPDTESLHRNLTNEEVAKLAKDNQTPAWTVVGTIYGNKSVVKAVKREIKSIFRQLTYKQIYSDSFLIKFANGIFNNLPNTTYKLLPFLKPFKEQLVSFNLGEEIMLGKPNKVALKLSYWRNPVGQSIPREQLSPHDDNCGLLWYAPLVVMKSEVVREFVEFIRSTCPKYNIEPFITFTNLRHDCVDSTIPIVFDLNNEQAVRDAHNCLAELVSEGRKKGYIPYRLNVDQQQTLLSKKDGGFWQTVDQIKTALDPNDVLSIGRYNPRDD